MIRTLDCIFALIALIFLSPLFLLVFTIGLFDTGHPLFKQARVGRSEEVFILFKFRTMQMETKHVATHLADPNNITKFGSFLRRTKLDELPQIWNVLIGDMSFVGPRPCLSSQTVLIKERKKRGVFAVRPGVTGLAQINGIDMSKPKLLSETDEEMINSLGLINYLNLILMTMLGKGMGDKAGLR